MQVEHGELGSLQAPNFTPPSSQAGTLCAQSLKYKESQCQPSELVYPLAEYMKHLQVLA